MGVHGGSLMLLMLLTSLVVWVSGQDTAPTEYKFDCRRTNVGCLNSGLCQISSGTCNCTTAGYEDYDCGLQSEKKIDTCAENQCENNGVCLSESGCYCDSNTYGSKCENPRVKMWCTDSQMFININPHGTGFSGKIYLRKRDGGDGKNAPECQLTAVNLSASPSQPNLTTYDYVKTVNNEMPAMEGFFIVQDHALAADATGVCQPAQKVEEGGRTDYTQQVLIEYNTVMVTSVDQIITFNCSISETASVPFTSENAMSVTLDDDDYEPVNVTNVIVPVLFEIRDPDTNTVITNNVQLGDPLDLVFTLQSSTGDVTNSSITDFKVTECTATNGQAATADQEPASMQFLLNDCPAPGSEMLYREQVKKSTTDPKRTTIPLRAFRFVGAQDAVAFTCSIKLCTPQMAGACVKNVCPGDASSETGGGDVGVTTEENTTLPPENTTPAGTTEAGTITPAPDIRRKRAAAEEIAKVNKTIRVTNGLDTSSQTGTDNGDDDDDENATKETDEDCMERSEVVIIIVIFAVIFVILVIALVAAVVNLLRSRKKVVDVPCDASASTDTHSRYTLPRLSLNTSM